MVRTYQEGYITKLYPPYPASGFPDLLDFNLTYSIEYEFLISTIGWCLRDYDIGAIEALFYFILSVL